MAIANFDDIAAGKAKRADVNSRLTILKNSVNNVASGQLDDLAVTAAKHADQSGSNDTKHSAASSTIADAGNIYTAAQVEAALQEIGNAVGLGGGGGALGAIKLLGYKEGGNSVDTILVPADSVANKIYVIAWSYGTIDVGTGGSAKSVKTLEHLIEDAAYADSGTLSVYGGSAGAASSASGGSLSNVMEITPTTAKSTTIRWKAGQTDTFVGTATSAWAEFKMIVFGY